MVLKDNYLWSDEVTVSVGTNYIEIRFFMLNLENNL